MSESSTTWNERIPAMIVGALAGALYGTAKSINYYEYAEGSVFPGLLIGLAVGTIVGFIFVEFFNPNHKTIWTWVATGALGSASSGVVVTLFCGHG